ncbi:XdhC family protein [Niveispirillum sp. KHB5.9]|uniref:XdhC family protein n=1 Tax=Niveispirillum sp. KHB5.9 TaxID=3400269 RepID=UPI003A85FD9E
MKARLFDALRKALTDRRPVALVTDLGSGLQTLVDADGRQQGEVGLEEEFLPQVLDAIRQDRRGIVEFYEGRFFINVFPPPNRLLIVGAVHLAQALVPAARMAGFDVTVIDPRAAFATPERFPDTVLVTEWPDEAITALRPDACTAVVVLSHDPKFDDPALTAALASDAFYIGALGGRRNAAARRERLGRQGVDTAQLARIHGPVGLDIGAVTPAEIALSILADIVLALRGPKWKAE